MIFEKYPAANWDVGSTDQVYFPVVKVTEDFENRIVERERPYRDGAKLDDTGSKARRWTIEVLFDNSLDEKGLSNNGAALYPDVMAEMLRSFDQHETGDLVLPTVGKVRARAKRYSRTEAEDLRDAARVSFTWIEDNEDDVNARSVAAPGVKGSARVLAETTTFSADADAVFDFDIFDLKELAAEVEAVLNAPSESMQELDQKVGAIVSSLNRVASAFSQSSVAGRDMLLDPDASATQRKIAALLDTVQRAKVESRRRRTTRILAERDTSLYDIATSVGQNPEEVIGLNPDLDPTFVEAGSLVRIYES